MNTHIPKANTFLNCPAGGVLSLFDDSGNTFVPSFHDGSDFGPSHGILAKIQDVTSGGTVIKGIGTKIFEANSGSSGQKDVRTTPCSFRKTLTSLYVAVATGNGDLYVMATSGAVPSSFPRALGGEVGMAAGTANGNGGFAPGIVIDNEGTAIIGTQNGKMVAVWLPQS